MAKVVSSKSRCSVSSTLVAVFPKPFASTELQASSQFDRQIAEIINRQQKSHHHISNKQQLQASLQARDRERANGERLAASGQRPARGFLNPT